MHLAREEIVRAAAILRGPASKGAAAAHPEVDVGAIEASPHF